MKKPIDWGMASFLISYQLFLLISLPFYFYFATTSLAMFGIGALLLYTAGLSVTAGYHRYFSHRTYKTRPIVESVLLFFGALALQGSALKWSHDHRLHHAHVDTDEDPYSINKGFWYAHFLWMLEKAKPIEPKLVSDLMQNPRVMFQHRFILPLMFGSNALVWLLVGWLMNDYLGSFFIAVALRIFVLHHFTWFINSLAHTWGDRPFCQEQTAVNNYALCFLTFGEGYHNYHHVFAKDYRNGVRWFHFDPTKWLIWTLSRFGLIKDLRRMDKLTIKKRLVLERKALLLEKIEKLPHVKQQQLVDQVESASSKMLDKLVSFNNLYKELRTVKQPALIKEFKLIQASLKEDWKNWKQLSRGILNQKTIST